MKNERWRKKTGTEQKKTKQNKTAHTHKNTIFFYEKENEERTLSPEAACKKKGEKKKEKKSTNQGEWGVDKVVLCVLHTYFHVSF